MEPDGFSGRSVWAGVQAYLEAGEDSQDHLPAPAQRQSRQQQQHHRQAPDSSSSSWAPFASPLLWPSSQGPSLHGSVAPGGHAQPPQQSWSPQQQQLPLAEPGKADLARPAQQRPLPPHLQNQPQPQSRYPGPGHYVEDQRYSNQYRYADQRRPPAHFQGREYAAGHQQQPRYPDQGRSQHHAVPAHVQRAHPQAHRAVPREQHQQQQHPQYRQDQPRVQQHAQIPKHEDLPAQFQHRLNLDDSATYSQRFQMPAHHAVPQHLDLDKEIVFGRAPDHQQHVQAAAQPLAPTSQPQAQPEVQKPSQSENKSPVLESGDKPDGTSPKSEESSKGPPKEEGTKVRKQPNRRQRDRTYGRSRVNWPSAMNVARINHQIEQFLPTIMPEASELTRTPEQVRARLESLVQTAEQWRGCTVRLFGSSVTLLGRPESDVDMCIIFPEAQRQELSALYDRERPPRPRKRTASVSPDQDSAGESPEAKKESSEATKKTEASAHDPPTKAAEDGEHQNEEAEQPEAPRYYSYKSYVVDELTQFLESHGFQEVLGLPRARVPIVKFVDPQSGLSCDLGIDNILAVRNSTLIRDYINFDPRVRPLCYLVKHWTKMRDINSPFRGTLSSYAYVILLFFYLMRSRPPVLPSLQELLARERRRSAPKENAPQEEAGPVGEQYSFAVRLPPDAAVINPEPVEGHDCSYVWSASLVSFWKDHWQKQFNRRSASLAELLVGFMRFFAREFSFTTDCVSIRTGTLLDKTAKRDEWVASGKRDFHLFSIEDPFEIGHDLGRVCDPGALFEVRGEFMRADKQLCERGDFVSVMQQYNLDDSWRLHKEKDKKDDKKEDKSKDGEGQEAKDKGESSGSAHATAPQRPKPSASRPTRGRRPRQ